MFSKVAQAAPSLFDNCWHRQEGKRYFEFRVDAAEAVTAVNVSHDSGSPHFQIASRSAFKSITTLLLDNIDPVTLFLAGSMKIPVRHMTNIMLQIRAWH